MFYSNKSSILVSGAGNSSKSKINSFMRLLNLQRILFLMCIVSSGEITWGMKEDDAIPKDEIKNTKLVSGSEEELDHYYNVVFLGDEQVGKTQILNLRTTNPFDNDYSPTVVPEQYRSPIIKDNNNIALSLIDTPGKETFRNSLRYVQSEQVIVLVYDVTKKESFDNIKKYWLDLAKGHAPEDAVYFLVGNKIDLGKRAVTTEEAKKYAEDKNMQFFEVSAKNGDNVDELFKNIVNVCLIKDKDIKEEVIKDYKQETNLNTQNTTQTKNKPCICCSCCPCNK